MGSSPAPGSGHAPALAGEQAALRRVAMLVARGVPRAEVFAAVAEEVGRVLRADQTFLARHNDDETGTVVAVWSPDGETAPVSYHGPLAEGGPAALVRATGRPVRVDRYPDDSLMASRGVRSGVTAPITVGGRLWGFMTVGWLAGPPPPGTEEQLAAFTELVAAAIASADAREELRRVADEQAALRRVATLVARGVGPDPVFAAVAEETGALFGADIAAVVRFEPDGQAILMGGHGVAWRETGVRFKPALGSAVASVRATGRAARFDAEGPAPAEVPEIFRTEGVRSAVNAPVVVESRLWGTVGVASRRGRLPVDTERQLAGFTELVATAIADAQVRTELRGFAEEQAALRRVATLVARGASPEEVFAAVAAEVARVLDVDFTLLSRYAPEGGAATIVGTWARSGAVRALPAGTRVELGGQNTHTLVFGTGRPARIDNYAESSGPAADAVRRLGLRSGVGVPIDVEGRLWGMMFVAYQHADPLPADAETRLGGFTELVATAVANAQARSELRGFAEEQAGLRRVATLVARGAQPGDVFAAVTAEAGRAVSADFISLWRYDSDGAVTLAGAWGVSRAYPMPVGTWLPAGGANVHTRVFHTGRPARLDEVEDDPGPGLAPSLAAGMRSGVAVPVTVEGRLWGAMVAASTGEPLPSDTEARLASFTELAATAIANAEAQAALRASRARIVVAADATRRRIERDLHDGAQQQLVSLALQLRTAQADVPPGAAGLAAQLSQAAEGLTGVVDELREFARGIHPAILADGGLGPALRTLARRSPIPVELDLCVPGRLSEQAEVCAYYVVSEALANAAKHSRAIAVTVEVTTADGALAVRVRDDGAGGARLGSGTGLIGLKDRVEAQGGQFTLRSTPGEGTTVTARLPLTAQSP
jgi:GAF domain-containing protein